MLSQYKGYPWFHFLTVDGLYTAEFDATWWQIHVYNDVADGSDDVVVRYNWSETYPSLR